MYVYFTSGCIHFSMKDTTVCQLPLSQCVMTVRFFFLQEPTPEPVPETKQEPSKFSWATVAGTNSGSAKKPPAAVVRAPEPVSVDYNWLRRIVTTHCTLRQTSLTHCDLRWPLLVWFKLGPNTQSPSGQPFGANVFK